MGRRLERSGCALVLAALFAVQLLMHLNCDNLLLDDWVFYGALADGVSLPQFLATRWQTWSSRLLIEGALALTTHSIWLWRVLDSAMMVLMAAALCRLAGAQGRWRMQALAAALVTGIPFAILRSTGWQATSVNYYWPLACALGALIPLADALWGRQTGRALAVLSLPMACFAASQEQTAALLAGAYAVLGAALVWRERRVRPLLAALLAVSCAMLALHLCCPGNAVRAAQSVALVNLRDYGQFSWVDKLSIGLTSTTALLFFTANPVLWACGVCALASVVGRRRNAGLVALAALPLAFALIAPALCAWARSGGPAGLAPFAAFGTYTLLLGPANIATPGHMGMVMLLIVLLGLSALTPYLSIGHRPLAACAALAFALGFAARMALSFSPTVVESGERTMLPLYGMLMLWAMLCVRDLREEGARRWPGVVAACVAALLAAQNVCASFALAA